jgi:endoglucanase
MIHVPGNGWTGAHAWTSSYYGTSNAVAMLNIHDPGDNTVFEVHQYLDSDSGGGGQQCVSSTIGSERMQAFIAWLRANGKKGFLGEFGSGSNATCNAAVTDLLNSVVAASDVMLGWAWWAAGPNWGEYMLTIEPKSGSDRPQMALLLPFLK